MPKIKLINFLGVIMEPLTKSFSEAKKYIVYYNGQQFEIEKETVLPWLNKMCDKSYFSPAYGVSINEYTLNEMKKGLWFEMVFNEKRTFAEMPFEKLLINIKPDFYGFNLIRYSNGLYDGRCFYLNLNNNSKEFYKNLMQFVSDKTKG